LDEVQQIMRTNIEQVLQFTIQRKE